MKKLIKKRAVLVGVNSYNRLANGLRAPVGEIQRWKDLLRAQFGFLIPDIVTLTEARATHPEVLEAIRKQLTGLEADDIFVLGLAGHGRIVRAHEPTAEYQYEEAFLTWPKKGDDELKSAELTDSDLAAVFADAGTIAGSKLDIIVDACHSGRLDIKLPPGFTPLTLPPVHSFQRGVHRVRPFGEIAGVHSTVQERPIVVAACGPDELATEHTVDGEPRLLFSARAIVWLQSHRNVTFDALVRDIQPLHRDIDQTPLTRGNTGRDHEPFPGGPSALSPGKAAASSSRGPEGLDGEERASSSRRLDRRIEAAASTPNSIDIYVKGICCFADARRESDPYQKRLLLPYDDRYDPDLRHIAFLEIDSGDVMDWEGPNEPIVGPHPGAPKPSYHRWELRGHAVAVANRVGNPDGTSPLAVADSYRVHVPGMKYGVEPDVAYHPADDCFDAAPNPDRVSSYADLDCGTLSAGPLELEKVYYVRSDLTWPTRWKERSPKWCVWNVPTTEAEAIIVLLPFDGGNATTIQLREGATVLLGNERQTDIDEENDPEENPAANFMLYYYLGVSVPEDPALPRTTSVPINACTNTNWP